MHENVIEFTVKIQGLGAALKQCAKSSCQAE